MAGPDGTSSSWTDLQRLRASFGTRARVDEPGLRALARTLGATAVPLCGRMLAGSADERAWALELMRTIAQVADERVRHELRTATGRALTDEAKLAALALLAELGDEETTARFADPRQMHQQSFSRFAGQLASPAEVASAADLLVSRLPPRELVEFVEAFSETNPERARELADELAARVDLGVAARGELSRVVAPLRLVRRPSSPARALGRPSLLAGLRHPDGRVVVVVARRVPGEPRWRALAILCAADGALDAVRYDDDATPRGVRDTLIAPLADDGYARFTLTTSAARRLVTGAARRAVTAGPALPSAYYLGRDLLGLGHSHLADGGVPADEPDRGALLGRAIDLLAGGAPARARPLLEHCARVGPDDADAHGHLGLCRYALGDYVGAVEALRRAVWLEPAWPLHHWNLAAAAHRVGDVAGCAQALHGFLDHAGDRLAAAIDHEHARRVALARRFLADHGALRRGQLDDQGLAPST
ncbi:MAG: hypothetical protein R3B06_25725 [Kofleriaceae bacterium]